MVLDIHPQMKDFIIIMFYSYSEANDRQQACEHDKNFNEDITPNTSGCEECEKEGWIALRMCISCGHVGCCDSSVGLHAMKHFQKTNHPVMIALPTKSWKWCYVDKTYI